MELSRSRWNSIDWKSEIRHRVAAHGPVMRGLREATGNELTFTHAVQARLGPVFFHKKVFSFRKLGQSFRLEFLTTAR